MMFSFKEWLKINEVKFTYASDFKNPQNLNYLNMASKVLATKEGGFISMDDFVIKYSRAIIKLYADPNGPKNNSYWGKNPINHPLAPAKSATFIGQDNVGAIINNNQIFVRKIKLFLINETQYSDTSGYALGREGFILINYLKTKLRDIEDVVAHELVHMFDFQSDSTNKDFNLKNSSDDFDQYLQLPHEKLAYRHGLAYSAASTQDIRNPSKILKGLYTDPKDVKKFGRDLYRHHLKQK